MATINTHAAAFMMISKAKCNKWVRAGGGLCVRRSRLATQPDTLWRVENGEEADVEKGSGGGTRAKGLARQDPEETVR